MKKIHYAHIILILLIIMLLFTFFKTDTKQNSNSFESQIRTFKNLGFKFNEGVTQNDILNMWGKHELEKKPYSLLYISLGGEVEKKLWIPVTNQCWHFDTEAIVNHDDYKRILDNIKRISSGELNFQNISDYIDIEQKKASVSFDLNGDNYTWNLKVEDDWVDESLFSKIVELTKKYKTNGKLTYFDTGGQDMVLGWANEEQLIKIKQETGLNIVLIK